MAETKTYIPISHLDDVGAIEANSDVLIISQKSNTNDQEYVSKKTTVAKLIDNIKISAASTEQIGGIKLDRDAVNQSGKDYFVKLDTNDIAYVSVPEADEDTIVTNNGKISVNDNLKELSEDVDSNNIVKKNEATAIVKAKDGQYIAGFKQIGGKIDVDSVQYGDLSSSSGISVVNTFDDATSNTVPSTALVKTNINAVDSKFNTLSRVAFSGSYKDLTDTPSEITGYVDLTANQSIDGVKTFQNCPTTTTGPSGTDDTEIVNVNYLKQEIKKIKSYTYTYTPLINWELRDKKQTAANGSQITWCYTNTSPQYKSVYSDGRYAQYVIPLKENFTNYKKLLIIPATYTNGWIESRIFDSQILDWMLSCEFIQQDHKPDIASIVQLHYHGNEQLFIPYNGSSAFPEQKADAHSAKDRFVMYYNKSYSYPILEIFGINETNSPTP